MFSTFLKPGSRATEQESGRIAAIRSIAAVASIGATAYFVVSVFALHFLRPDLDPISRPISEYAVGPFGFLMSTAFLSFSLASVALAVALYQSLSASALSRVGFVFLGGWAVGLLIALLFPIDPGGVPQTISGAIHQGAAPPTFLCLAIGMTLVSWRFNRDEMWVSLQRPALILSAIFWAGFLATFVSFVTGSGTLGITQRITLSTGVIWMLLAAVRIRSIPAGPVSD